MFAKVRFSVTAGLYTDFLNYIIEENYQLFDIKSTQFGFEAVCYAENYRKIASAAGRFQCKIRIIGKKGIYFRLRKFRNRKGLLAGALIFMLLTYVFSNIIWDIRINAADSTMEAEIAALLYRQNISPGSFYSAEKLQQAREDILFSGTDISFISLNFYKGILDCKAYPKKRKADYISDLTDQDIYSSMTGIITDLRVYSGYSQVELGQSVSQGDLLVSHITSDIFENTYTSRTRAYIEALCDKKYSVYIPFRKHTQVLTGKSDKTVYIEFAGKSFCVDKADIAQWPSSVDKTKIDYFTFMGFHLPFTVREISHYQLTDVMIENDTLTARNIAGLQLQHLIENDDLLKEEINRSYDFIIDDEGLQLNCTVTGHYRIA